MNCIKVQKLSHLLYHKGFKRLSFILHRIIKFFTHCVIYPQTQIGNGTFLGYGGIGVVIHRDSIIGDNCVIAQHVTLASKDGRAPIIGNGVYIGHGSIILGGVHVGDNSFIGALTLVNKDVPEGSIYVGIPGKVLKVRTKEEINEYLSWQKANQL